MIKITNLDKVFNRGKQNEIHVLKNVSLELPDKGMVAVFGRSGCGKTTLLNLLGGLDRARAGEISVNGQTMDGSADELRNRSVGYIFQNYCLNKANTCFENVADALLLCGMTDKAEIERRVNAVLAAVGMEHYAKRTPDTLSGGQQQRIAIARAIVKNPAVILADEPTGNLDEANTLHIMRLLKAISRDRLVVLVTHEEKLVDVFCDRVISLSDGAVIGDSENHSTEHYTVRDKNTVYLGELEKADLSTPDTGISLNLFGEKPEHPVSIRLISTNGKIYLKVDSPEVRVLDDSSEIKLVDGKFEGDTPKPENETQDTETKNDAEDHYNLPSLSITSDQLTKPAGRLFGFRSAWKSGLKVNFGIKKKGRKLLRNSLILFAAVLVFMTASLGVFVRNLSKAGEEYHHKAVYVYAGDEESVEKLKNANLPGVNYTQVLTGSPGSGLSQYRFNIGQFETFSGSYSYYTFSDSTQIAAKGTSLLRSRGLSKNLVTGKNTNLADNEILISTGFADALIASSTVGYINTYDDLIGLFDSDSAYKIAGIVSESERELYFPESSFSYLLGAGFSDNVYLSSQFGLTEAERPASGNVFIYYVNKPESTGKTFSVGDQVKINGVSFNVEKIIRAYDFNYESWSADYGYTLPDLDAYMEAKIAEDYPTITSEDDPDYYDAYDDCYDRYLADYCFAFLSHYGDYVKNTYRFTGVNSAYAVCWLDRGISDAYYFQSGESDDVADALRYLYYVNLWKKENPGAPNPTNTQLLNWADEKDDWEMVYLYKERGMEIEESLYSSYYNYSYYPYDKLFSIYNNGFVVNDADLTTTLSYPGPTTLLTTCRDYSNWYNEIYYYPGDEVISAYSYLLLICDNPEEVASEVNKLLGDHYAEIVSLNNGYLDEEYNLSIYTPATFRASALAYVKADIISDAVELAVFLGIMSICMYFIMRSATMGRIREIGIYRAIGVSKKNLLFRFFVESLAVTSVTVLIGYIFSSVLIYSWLTKVPLLSEQFFYPPWMAAATLVLLYAVSVFCGILPVLRLLRKTPAEILSKYDI